MEGEKLTATENRIFKNDEVYKIVHDYKSLLLEIKDYNFENSFQFDGEEVNNQPFVGHGIPPIEKIEIRDRLRNSMGYSAWMIIIDFNFTRINNVLKTQKVYMNYFRDWYQTDYQLPEWVLKGIVNSKEHRSKIQRRAYAERAEEANRGTVEEDEPEW